MAKSKNSHQTPLNDEERQAMTARIVRALAAGLGIDPDEIQVTIGKKEEPPPEPITTEQPAQDRQLLKMKESLQSLLPKPGNKFYLKVTPKPAGRFFFEKIEFLTVNEAAEFVRVDPRTIHLWIANADATGLKFYRAPGGRYILFDVQEFIDWIKEKAD